jgi:hypothetical protein
VEHIGAVRFTNITAVDNTLGGFEVNRIIDVRDDPTASPQIDGGVFVGRSHKTIADPTTFQGVAQDDALKLSAANISPCGVITPQADFFKVKNIKFFNYDFNQAAPLCSCSHCFKPPATDSDGRTVHFEGLSFSNTDTPNALIRWQEPFKSIFYDADGSIAPTNGAGGWVVSNRDLNRHNLWNNECSADSAIGGIVCKPDVTVRRVLIYDMLPGNIVDKTLYILPYDDSIVASMNQTELDAYVADTSNYGVVPMRFKKNPFNHWLAPMVTGHKYYMKFENILNIEQAKIQIVEPLWDDRDKNIIMTWPFTDPRERIELTYPDGKMIANQTLGAIWNDHNKLGANIVYNHTWEDREDIENEQMSISFAIAAHSNNNPQTPDFINELKWIGVRGSTVEEVDESLVLSDDECLWSDPVCWTTNNGAVPVAGDEVVIDGSMNIVLDVNATDMPILKSLEINGKLRFQAGFDRALKSYKIWVRAGEMHIGNATHPFDSRADITLYGNDLEEYWAYTASTEVGNKGLIITGKVYMYGEVRGTATKGRLYRSAYAD